MGIRITIENRSKALSVDIELNFETIKNGIHSINESEIVRGASLISPHRFERSFILQIILTQRFRFVQ